MRRILSRAFSSFTVQLFWCIFSTAIVLLIVGLLLLSNYTTKAAVRMNNEGMEENLRVAASNIDTALNEVDRVAYLIFAQDDVLSVAKKSYTYPSEEYNIIRNSIRKARISSTNISEIVFCDTFGNLFASFTSGSQSVSNIYHDLPSCKAYLESLEYYTVGSGETWYFLQTNPLSPHQYTLMNVREINLSAHAESPLLLIYFSEDKLSMLYHFLGDGSFLMTDTGKIISAVEKEPIGTSVEADLRNCITESKTAVSFELNGIRYHSTYCSVIGCYLVIPSDSAVLADVNRSTTIVTTVILIAGIILSIIWSRMIAHSVTRPLVVLKQKMELVQEGNLTVRCHTQRRDEVGYLYNSFNYMMDMVKQYLEQHERQQLLAQKAELQLMQAQINPHLLYNSLDSALFLLNRNNPELSAKVLEELSRFFRLSLQKGSKIVTVAEAIELAKTYLRLQNLCRMKDYQLEVTGDISVLNVNILHMCLQPIVENSVLHGLDGSYADGIIEIQLSRENEDILIRVQDNGIGMEESQLRDLCKKISSPTVVNGGYGLWNVSRRMKIHYGEKYGLSIESEMGEYTAVTLRFPGKPQEAV